MKSTPYTSEELVDMLKARMGESSQTIIAAEIGISNRLLSDILRGERAIVNELVLKWLAGPKKKFVHRDCWYLEPD